MSAPAVLNSSGLLPCFACHVPVLGYVPVSCTDYRQYIQLNDIAGKLLAGALGQVAPFISFTARNLPWLSAQSRGRYEQPACLG